MVKFSRSYVQVIGNIWQPGIGTCAMQYSLSMHDVDAIGDIADRRCKEQHVPWSIAREDVGEWLSTHSGDCKNSDDFYAIIEDVDIEWADMESAFTYHDCV